MARLSYDAVTCQVWLDVVPERPGSVQEICELHVDRLTVPRGWMLCDRRVEEPAMFLTDPTPQPPRPPRTRPRPSDPVRVVTMVEPELFDAPVRSGPVRSGPDRLDLVDEVEPDDEVTVVEEAATDEYAVEEAADDPLLRPSSPLLARAFRAAGTRPSVFEPRPDALRDGGPDDGTAT